jgi:hypothetical protein
VTVGQRLVDNLLTVGPNKSSWVAKPGSLGLSSALSEQRAFSDGHGEFF